MTGCCRTAPFTLVLSLIFSTATSNTRGQADSTNELARHWFGFFLGIDNSVPRTALRPASELPTSLVDSVQSISAFSGVGFSFGIVDEIEATKHWTFRALGALSFNRYGLDYYYVNGATEQVPLEHTDLYLALHIKYCHSASEKGPYVALGPTVNYRLTNGGDLGRTLFGIDGGIGWLIPFPFIVVAPEVRFNYGLNDLLYERGTVYTEVINGLWVNTWSFRLCFRARS